jgi:hypothetical protein
VDSSLSGNLQETTQIAPFPEDDSNVITAERSFRHLGFRAIAVLLGIALAFL